MSSSPRIRSALPLDRFWRKVACGSLVALTGCVGGLVGIGVGVNEISEDDDSDEAPVAPPTLTVEVPGEVLTGVVRVHGQVTSPIAREFEITDFSYSMNGRAFKTATPILDSNPRFVSVAGSETFTLLWNTFPDMDEELRFGDSPISNRMILRVSLTELRGGARLRDDTEEFTIDMSRISTIAGGATGQGTPALDVALDEPSSIAVKDGVIYIADTKNHVIRKIEDGVTSLVAGDGTRCFAGDGDLAEEASLDFPGAITFRPDTSNIVIADSGNDVIREIQDGIIDTVPGTEIGLEKPQDVEFDSKGVLYIADTWNNRIVKLDAGNLVPVVDNGERECDGAGDTEEDDPRACCSDAPKNGLHRPTGIAFDSKDCLYVADTCNNRVLKFCEPFLEKGASLDEFRIYKSVPLLGPSSLSVESDFTFLADSGNSRILRFLTEDTEELPLTIVGSSEKVSETADRPCEVEGPIRSFGLNEPLDLSTKIDGTILVADSRNNLVRSVLLSSRTGETIAGTGNSDFFGDEGPGIFAGLDQPDDVAVDINGNIYIVDKISNRIRMVSKRTGRIYTIVGNGLCRVGGDDLPGLEVSIDEPRAIALNSKGDLYISDSRNNLVRRVRKIDTECEAGVDPDICKNDPAWEIPVFGNVEIVAGTAVSGANGVAPPCTGRGDFKNCTPGPFDPENVLCGPEGITVDSKDNVYIADSRNNRIVKVAVVDDPNGTTTYTVTTHAGNGCGGEPQDGADALSTTIPGPLDLTFDGAGNLYVISIINTCTASDANGICTDDTIVKNMVVRIDPQGKVQRVFGIGLTAGCTEVDDLAANACFNGPRSIAFEPLSGDLFLAEAGAGVIRRIHVEGENPLEWRISTIAGEKGQICGLGDGGCPRDARFDRPFGLAVDDVGNLYVALRGQNRIRRFWTGQTCVASP